MEIITDVLLSHLIYSIIPSIFFTLLFFFDIYTDVSLKNRLFGALRALCCSYCCVITAQCFLYYLIELLVGRYFTREGLMVIQFIVFICVLFVFCYLVVLNIKAYNKIPGVRIKEPLFGIFIYATYLLILYVGLIFADSVLSFNIFILVTTNIWYFSFKKSLYTMPYIYSDKLFSTSNVCLFFEVFVVVMLYFLPGTLYIKGIDITYYLRWVETLSIVLYVYCITIHKIIFNNFMHENEQRILLSTDNLTGLCTRTYFLQEGQQMIDNADDNKVAIVFINICNFKYYNQNYGDEIGDKILLDVSIALRKLFGEKSLIARLSDDHFAILTKEYKYLSNTLVSLDMFLEQEIENYNIKVRVGVFFTTSGMVKITEALDCAIRASHDAEIEKNVGIRFYDAEVIENEKRNEFILNNLDKAIEMEWLKVYYQPIFDVKTRKLAAAEALVRWIDDKNGYLAPDLFIPLLESNNLIYKIDCYVLEEICKKIRKLLDQGVSPVPISFNVSRRDFHILDMVEYTDKIVAKYNIPKEYVKVEITESALVADEEVLSNQVNKFQEHGYKVWMDDFGAGYSSLNGFSTLVFNGIKLDLVFLRNLTPKKLEVMRGIVAIANRLGVEVLTEGVETEEHMQVLDDIGCQKAQGYLFSKPIPFDEFMNEIEVHKWEI